jgi:ligand-binding sensor domain-containing protein/putative methionine-R-sulfoxide reductase with GAF domain/anti-sigma regulatory factor (Ser/Thr protein kinase)
MWIGYQTGLQRFDGTKFKNYLADVRDTAALQSDWVSAIFEDSKKRFWIGNDVGTAYTLNRATGKFYNYNLHTSPQNKISGITCFKEDKLGAIWALAHDGLYKLNENKNQFEKQDGLIGLTKFTNPGIIGGVVFDKANNIWLNTSTGIKFYNRREKKLYDANYNPRHDPVFDLNLLGGFILLTQKKIWFTGNGAFYKYDPLTGGLNKFSIDKLPSKKIDRVFQKESVADLFCADDDKVIIALAGRGLAVYNPAKNNFSIVEIDNTNPIGYHSLEDMESRVMLMQDNDKNIIIGTDAGINIYNKQKQLFNIHKTDLASGNLFPKTEANDFLQMPNGDILISYYFFDGGIVKTDSNFQFKKHYLYNEHGNKKNFGNVLWTLFNDGKGNIWAPNQQNGILKLDLKTEKLSEDKDSALGGPIITIKQDKQGDIWMGHWRKGLVKKDGKTNKYSFYTNFLQTDSTYKKRVHCILFDGNLVWAGTQQNGLQVFDKTKEKFVEAFVTDIKNETSISSNCVTDIIEYNKDTLVLATLMGINIFDKKNKTFKTITTKEGLPNNLVQTVMSDGLGNVWAACYQDGFCKINMTDFAVTNYGINDGLTDNIFTNKFRRLKNGTFLLGTSESFISFNPASFSASAAPRDVLITGLHFFEKDIQSDSSNYNNQTFKTTYRENSVRIDFASLEYWNPENIKYYYRLNGADKDWILADKNHTAIYNQLNDGKYLFEIKCTNRDGIFCKNITTLKIIITPPFWKTWWFRLLLAFLTFYIIYLFIKWRVKNIKAIAAEKLKVQQLNAEQYKSKLELEQIINYFSSSLIDKHTVDAVLWDVAKNLIGRLGFVDCMIYLWNDDKTKMLQKAGHGPKDSEEEIRKQLFEVLPGQGLVGYVMQSKEALVVADTAKDSRYRPDDIVRLSEITVPIIYNDELIGVLDSEHPERNFYTPQHLQVLTTIATLVANKIKSIEAEQVIQQKNIEVYSMNEQLSKAKLEALRSQMNPHFIFNSLNAIQECILTNNVDAAYKYLSKFSKLQRMVLNNSQKELIPLSDEIEMLQLYLSLESLRFSKSFVYSIDITGITDTNEIMIPSLITQPLVENAIWHGLRNKEGDKILAIIYEEKHGTIFITIDDNGIGRDAAAAIKKQKIGSEQFASKGTLILQQRLQVLSQQLNADIQLETTDKKDEQGNAAGTKVTLSFPANLEVE